MDHIRLKDAAAMSFSSRVVGEREAEEMDCGMIRRYRDQRSIGLPFKSDEDLLLPLANFSA